jgi:SPX domain protein involved in polyphosphate accumulation
VFQVYAFHQEKVDDIRTRTDHWAETIGTTRTTTITVDELGRIQETINAIADDINQLARYSRVNYTGFLKIVKKHDRHTNYVLRPMFMVRLNQCPFWNDKNDALLVKLSQLFAQVRQGGKTMSFQHPTRQNEPISTLDQHQQQQQQKVVVRRFFVKKDNVLELKTFVLRHLPVLVYQDNTTSGTIDPPISTLYLDNSDLDTYNSRVEKAPGSQIVRLRWYGSAHCNSSIAFERRTLAEESCGELKDRFVIKDKYISDFLHGGQAYINKYSQKLQAMASKSDKDIVSFQTLVNQVQQTLLNQPLQPGKKKKKKKRNTHTGSLKLLLLSH